MFAFTVGKSNKNRGKRTNIMSPFSFAFRNLADKAKAKAFLKSKTNLKLVKNKKTGTPPGARATESILRNC